MQLDAGVNILQGLQMYSHCALGNEPSKFLAGSQTLHHNTPRWVVGWMWLTIATGLFLYRWSTMDAFADRQ